VHGVVHLEHHEVRIAYEEAARQLATPGHVRREIVRVETAAKREQKGLRQPWHAERGGEMHGAAVRSPDLLLVDLLDPAGRQRLPPFGEPIELLACASRERVYDANKTRQRRRNAGAGKGSPVQAAPERVELRRRGIEVRAVAPRASPSEKRIPRGVRPFAQRHHYIPVG
jgi:hypothetical protein